MHARLWERDPEKLGEPAPFTPVEHVAPVDVLDADFPIRLTTVRVLDAYNSGVQTGGYSSPMRRRESLRMDAEDAAKLGIADGERIRVVSRRGAVEAPVWLDPSLRPGLASFTPHFTEEVDVNVLTNDAWDPKSGTSEFKATAIRIEKTRATTQPARCRRRERNGSSPVGGRAEHDRAGRDRHRVRARTCPAPAHGDRPTRSVHSGHGARAQRHLLLPVLHAVHDAAGWISEGALNHVARTLNVPPAEIYGVATFYAMFAVEPQAPRVVHVCDDVACGPYGGEEIAAAAGARAGPGGRGARTGARPGARPHRAARRTARPAGCAAPAWDCASGRRR